LAEYSWAPLIAFDIEEWQESADSVEKVGFPKTLEY
jgi:hypothetical protein